MNNNYHGLELEFFIKGLIADKICFQLFFLNNYYTEDYGAILIGCQISFRPSFTHFHNHCFRLSRRRPCYPIEFQIHCVDTGKRDRLRP